MVAHHWVSAGSDFAVAAVPVATLDVFVVSGRHAVIAPSEAVVDGIFDLYLFEAVYVHVKNVDAAVVGAVGLCGWLILAEHRIVLADHLFSP